MYPLQGSLSLRRGVTSTAFLKDCVAAISLFSLFLAHFEPINFGKNPKDRNFSTFLIISPGQSGGTDPGLRLECEVVVFI
jgi:hypothetical protein